MNIETSARRDGDWKTKRVRKVTGEQTCQPNLKFEGERASKMRRRPQQPYNYMHGFNFCRYFSSDGYRF